MATYVPLHHFPISASSTIPLQQLKIHPNLFAVKPLSTYTKTKETLSHINTFPSYSCMIFQHISKYNLHPALFDRNDTLAGRPPKSAWWHFVLFCFRVEWLIRNSWICTPSSLLPGTPTHITKVHTSLGPFPHANATTLYPATSPPPLFPPNKSPSVCKCQSSTSL
jgi:hypothetical protein